MDAEVLSIPKTRNTELFRALGRSLAEQLDAITEVMCERMLTGIPGLPQDASTRRLLHASVRANVDVASRIYLEEIDIEDVHAPAAALDYARQLALREAPANAVARAYRVGQFMVTDWAIDELTRLLSEPVAQIHACRELNAVNFWYIDKISELVLAEYQAERDRWLAHRTTVTAETLTQILDGRDIDLTAAENALSYRLRQTHVAGVIWIDDLHRSSADLAGLERASRKLASAAGISGEGLFWLREPTTAWWWIPWNEDRDPNLDVLREAIASLGPHLRIALGGRGSGVEGFCESHRDALLAEQVARVAGNRAPALVSATDQGVRAAALLVADLAGARRLVCNTLGDLAADTRTAADLRSTLQVYLQEGGSQRASAQRLHVHKNTIAYRLARATEICGQSLKNNRVDLELALAACQWLGPAVLDGS